MDRAKNASPRKTGGQFCDVWYVPPLVNLRGGAHSTRRKTVPREAVFGGALLPTTPALGRLLVTTQL